MAIRGDQSHIEVFSALVPWPPVQFARSDPGEEMSGAGGMGLKPAKLLGRFLERMADLGIRVLLRLKALARYLDGGKRIRVDIRKIILNELLVVAKGMQKADPANDGDKS